MIKEQYDKMIPSAKRAYNKLSEAEQLEYDKLPWYDEEEEWYLINTMIDYGRMCDKDTVDVDIEDIKSVIDEDTYKKHKGGNYVGMIKKNI